MIDPDQKLARAKDAVRGGIALGQAPEPVNPYLALPEDLRTRVAMDMTANTLLAEAKHMIMRCGLLYANDTGAWVDQQANNELAYRCNMALKVLDGTMDGAALAQGATE
jgi:hypothetical protein